MKEAYDAIKWNYQNLDDILNFGTEVIDMGCVPTTNGSIESWPLQVKTEEGNVVMEYDNWLIRCDDGTYYVRKTVKITPKLKSNPEPIPVNQDEWAEKLYQQLWHITNSYSDEWTDHNYEETQKLLHEYEQLKSSPSPTPVQEGLTPLNEEWIEEIKTALSFKETNVELGHRQTLIGVLYDFYKNAISAQPAVQEGLREDELFWKCEYEKAEKEISRLQELIKHQDYEDY